MWDTVVHSPGAHDGAEHLSHDLPCLRCGHAFHVYLACDEGCSCPPVAVPDTHAA